MFCNVCQIVQVRSSPPLTKRLERPSLWVVYLDDITGDLAPRIDAVEKYTGGNGKQAVLESPVIMTADEWAEFSKGL